MLFMFNVGFVGVHCDHHKISQVHAHVPGQMSRYAPTSAFLVKIQAPFNIEIDFDIMVISIAVFGPVPVSFRMGGRALFGMPAAVRLRLRMMSPNDEASPRSLACDARNKEKSTTYRH